MHLQPADILPERLGLSWDFTEEECLPRMRTHPCSRSEGYLSYPISLTGDGRDELHLAFYGGKLSVIIVQRRPVGERCADEWTCEEMYHIWKEYRGAYDALCEQWTAVLGPSIFSGSATRDAVPDIEDWSEDGYLTCWDLPAARWKIKLEQGRRPPVILSAECCPPRKQLATASFSAGTPATAAATENGPS